MINKLIFPTTVKEITNNVFSINDKLNYINTKLEKIDYNFYISGPSIMFKLISLLEKQSPNPIYKDLFLYEKIDKSPYNIRFTNNNISYFSNNKESPIYLNNYEYIIKSIITLHENDEHFSVKITNNGLSTSKSLYFKSNRENYKKAYKNIDDIIDNSKPYYETFIEIFQNNNHLFLDDWIKQNSLEVFCFSLYYMNSEMRIEAISKYNQLHNHLNFQDYIENISKIIKLVQLNDIERKFDQSYKENILSSIEYMKKEGIENQLEELFKTIKLNNNLHQQLDTKEKKVKISKI